MPMPICKGECESFDFPYKITKKITYSNGFLTCSACTKSIQCNLIKCPCCHCDLRTKPRHKKDRIKILNEVKRY